MAEINQKLVRSIIVEELHKHHIRDVEQLFVSNVDRRKLSRIFELVSCLKLGMRPWSMLSPDVVEARGGLVRYGANNTFFIPDYGIDAATDDITTVNQSKWYVEGGHVHYTALATFHTYSVATEAKELILTSSEGVRLHRLSAKLPIKHVQIPDNEIRELLAPSFEGSISYDMLEELRDDITNDPLRELYDETPLPDWVDELLDCVMINTIPIVKTRLSLRKHQEEGVDLLLDSLGNDTAVPATAKCAVICGGGKTIMAAELILRRREEAEIKRWAVMVPYCLLLHQVAAVMKTQCPEMKVAMVGDGHGADPDADILVCVYNSVDEIKDLDFDLVVVDEAHHVEAAFAAEDAAGVWKVKIRALKSPRFVLMSATLSDDEWADYSYTLEDGIRDKNLTDYEIVIPVHTEGDRTQMLAEMARDRTEWTRILAYCNSRKEARAFCALLERLNVRAAHFDGETPIAARTEIIRQFAEGNIRVLCTVNVLSEGIDIPRADTCMFVEARNSQIDVIQCVGRVLRLCEEHGKRLSHIVLPATSEEPELVRFLKIMNRHDSRLALSIMNRTLGRVNFIHQIPPEEGKFASLLDIAVYDRLGNLVANNVKWVSRFNILCEYIEEKGEIPSKNVVFKGDKIGVWCVTQRDQKRAGILSLERVQRLESLKLWVWGNILDDRWNWWCTIYRQFVEANGKRPEARDEFKGEKVGQWMHSQRQHKKENLPRMTTGRIAILTALPQWVWEEPNYWRGMYEQLVAYIEENGKCPSTKNGRLGQWISTQRKAKKGKGKFKITQDQIDELDLLDEWFWEAESADSKWTRRFESLKKFIARFKRLPEQKESFDSFRIGSWVDNQRKARKGAGPKEKRGRMTPDRVRLLDGLKEWRW